MGNRAVCPRCNGAGVIPHFNHVREGVCFRCWGTGDDLPQALKEAQEGLDQLRAEWTHLNNKAKATKGQVRENWLAARDSIEAKGKELAARVVALKGSIERFKALAKANAS